MIADDLRAEYLGIEMAQQLGSEIGRVDERSLAERLLAAVETAKRQMRTG
jgi:hypothetical protein